MVLIVNHILKASKQCGLESKASKHFMKSFLKLLKQAVEAQAPVFMKSFYKLLKQSMQAVLEKF